jgi:hypothetical protein
VGISKDKPGLSSQKQDELYFRTYPECIKYVMDRYPEHLLSEGNFGYLSYIRDDS